MGMGEARMEVGMRLGAGDGQLGIGIEIELL